MGTHTHTLSNPVEDWGFGRLIVGHGSVSSERTKGNYKTRKMSRLRISKLFLHSFSEMEKDRTIEFQIEERQSTNLELKLNCPTTI